MKEQNGRLPAWLTQFQEQYQTHQVHSFLFYQNVWDDFVKDRALKRIYEMLREETPVSQAAIVVYFNRTTGIRFADEDSQESLMENLFLRIAFGATSDADMAKAKAQFQDFKRRLVYVLTWFDELLKTGWDSPKIKEDEKIQEILQAQHTARHELSQETAYHSEDETGQGLEAAEIERQKQSPFAVVIFEYADNLVPPEAVSSGTTQDGELIDRRAINAFQWWAQDSIIRSNNNLILYVAEALNSIAPDLRDPTQGFYPIKVELPQEQDILETIKILRQKFPAKPADVSDQHLAHLMKGLPIVGIKTILADTRTKKEKLSVDLVFECKSKIIEEKTGGLLRIKQAPWGYDTLGDLDHVLDYVKEVVAAIRSGDFMAVPSGAIFIGAPGTGKTAAAEVIAREAGIPFAEFGGVRDPFVGMSERNMELALEILRANAPVIVFQDEIDSFFLPRGQVYHGDTGVNSRLTGMLMEFLSDPTIRGKVVWIGATNRPDLLDVALIRAGRFDDKIAFCIPRASGRPKIIKALLRKQEIRAQLHGQTFSWELSDEQIQEMSDMLDFWINSKGQLSPGPPPEKGVTVTKISFTGAEIEVVIQRADRLRRRHKEKTLSLDRIETIIHNFKPRRDMAEYAYMDSMALVYADDLRLIPEDRRDEALKLSAEALRGGGSFDGNLNPRSP